MSDITGTVEVDIDLRCDQCGAEAEVKSLDDFPAAGPLPCHACGAPLISREELERKIEEAFAEKIEKDLREKLSGSGFKIE